VVKLPPPVWALFYLIAAGALSWMYAWRRLNDLRIVWLGVALIAFGFVHFVGQSTILILTGNRATGEA